MSTNKFVGIAYWSVTTGVADWLAKALDVLMPVEKAGLAVLAFDCLPGGNQLSIQFGDERYVMPVNEGKGRGVVRPSPSATMFVVCLLALRKALGDISVVTDSQETIPTLPRQNYPLYADTWERVLPVAQELGLATGAAFTASHKAVLNNMF
ncbi:hypothetical protein [Accumulibacter sp.]|jgi:hypothetical protein|uniref:hypothetical protein n=1 Tax=Accumulibacter sp. TaxID=2053492 RepID=UPI0026029389|nr:hypothetical protein [Accumulibacter sp.]